MYDHTFYKLANQQTRHQATHKMGCQPGDFAYGYFIFLRGLCGTYSVMEVSNNTQNLQEDCV